MYENPIKPQYQASVWMSLQTFVYEVRYFTSTA
jgi:hypothetical protein